MDQILLSLTGLMVMIINSQFFFILFFGIQDISCVKELTSLYEAASIEDIYLAYDQLKVDEESLFSCIGIAGVNAGEGAMGEDMLQFNGLEPDKNLQTNELVSGNWIIGKVGHGTWDMGMRVDN